MYFFAYLRCVVTKAKHILLSWRETTNDYYFVEFLFSMMKPRSNFWLFDSVKNPNLFRIIEMTFHGTFLLRGGGDTTYT